MNFCFLSNESQPLSLDESDRRYLVVWTPPKLGLEFYAEVRAEIQQGGLEAFAWHLLNLDLDGFDEHTKPIQTAAKQKLIELSANSAQLFHMEWMRGELDIPTCACLVADCYQHYGQWCRRNGERLPMSKNRFSREIERCNVPRAVKRYLDGAGKERQHTVFLPAPHQPQGHKAEIQWLSDEIARFRSALNDSTAKTGAAP